MSEELNQKNNLLEIAEIVSIIASIAGSIASVISQQAILAALPLSVTVTLNFFNRKELLNSLNKLPDQNQHLISELNFQQEKLITELAEKIEILQGNYQKITKLENKIEKNNEQIPSILTNLNDLKQQLEDLENNRFPELKFNQQSFLEQIKKIQVSIENFQTIIDSSYSGENNYINSSELYYQKGIENENLGQTEIAISNYTLAIQLDNNQAKAYYRRGNLYVQTGNKKAAIDDLRHSAKLFFEQGDIENYQKAKDHSQELYDLSNEINKDQAQPELLFLDNLLS
jgi:tetratricopeptide (TPR) repeat protein